MKEKAIALVDANKSYCKCCGKRLTAQLIFMDQMGKLQKFLYVETV